jgi:hypothetical protein
MDWFPRWNFWKCYEILSVTPQGGNFDPGNATQSDPKLFRTPPTPTTDKKISAEFPAFNEDGQNTLDKIHL